MSFAEVVARTQCPFAGMAVWRELRLEVPAEPDDALRTLRQYGSALRREIPAYDRQEIDMVALELDHRSLVTSVEPFATAVRWFIEGLHAEECYAQGELDFEESDWLLIVEGVRLFAFTFAPFYEPSHPRHSPTESAYIVIQFLHSFRKIGMHQMTLSAKKRLSNRVRGTFEAAAVPYFAYITQDSPEVLKMIKPLHEGDEPVRWWLEPERH